MSKIAILDEDSLARSLRALVPHDVSVACGPVRADVGALFDVEREAIARAVPKRCAEFASGRIYARAALRALGVPDQPIPRAADRQPLWPNGVVGTITHSNTVAAAMVSSARTYLGLGLDLEDAAPLSSDLYRAIAHPSEQGTFGVPVRTAAGPVDRGKLIFAIKETVFKATYPATGQFIDFQAATVTVSEEGTFKAHLVEPVLGDHRRDLWGRWTVMEGYVAAALALRR